jgi:ribosomal protein S1
VDGLVHISDMSWTRRINHPSEVVQKGEDVEAVITSIDSYNQRISLSMKELLPNEWEEYANVHGVGDVSTGKITNVTDFGVFVELAPGVEGLCHISEIDRDEGLALAEMYSAGQAVRCRILRVDWHESRIGLSMHAVEQDGVEDEVTVETAESAAADTAMAAALRAGGVVDEESADESEIDEESPDTAEKAEAAEADAEAETEVAAADEVEDASADTADTAEEDEPAGEAAVEPGGEDAEPLAETGDDEVAADASTEDEGAEPEADSDTSEELEGEPEASAEEPAQAEGDEEEKKD